MERSFEDATAFVRVARRRHGGVKDASTSKQLQEDYDALLADNNDDGESDDARRETGDVERGNDSAPSMRPSEDNTVDAVAMVVVEESDASEDESDSPSAVPGFDDFGPALCAVDDAKRKKKRLKPTSSPSRTFARRALDAVRNVGLVGAAALFGTFLVFVAFAVYEEMRNDGTDALRPELGPMAYVDSRTVAEEAAIRGESAKEALLDVERESKRTD